MTYIEKTFRINRAARAKTGACGVSDREGHYDIDGVSFERGIGVIVASDGSHFRRKPDPDKLAKRPDILSGPGVSHD